MEERSAVPGEYFFSTDDEQSCSGFMQKQKRQLQFMFPSNYSLVFPIPNVHVATLFFTIADERLFAAQSVHYYRLPIFSHYSRFENNWNYVTWLEMGRARYFES